MVYNRHSIFFNSFSSGASKFNFGAFLIGLTLIFFSQQNFQVSKVNKKNFISPSAEISHFSLGFSETLADLFWIRAIQDFDYCDSPINKNTCRGNSWLFHMLDTITNLSPHYRLPYSFGGLALSVIITDVDGASKIFEKGMKEFPNDWQISYKAGYHFLYEVNDPVRAAQIYLQCARTGGPEWLQPLAGRLLIKAGKTEVAERLLQEMIDTHQPEGLIKRLQEKIAAEKNKNSAQ